MDTHSGLQLTIFGATGNIGLRVGGYFGEMGSDIIYPVRESIFTFDELIIRLK